MRLPPRDVFRREDIINALVSYITTVVALSGRPDVVAVRSLCATFGISLAEIRDRLETNTLKDALS